MDAISWRVLSSIHSVLSFQSCSSNKVLLNIIIIKTIGDISLFKIEELATEMDGAEYITIALVVTGEWV